MLYIFQEAEQPQQPQSITSTGNRMTTSYLRQPTLVKASPNHEITPNARLITPKSPKVYLPPRDDAAEFDDSGKFFETFIKMKSIFIFVFVLYRT